MPRLSALVLIVLLAGCDGGGEEVADGPRRTDASTEVTAAAYCDLFGSEPPGIDSTDPDSAVAAAHELAEEMRRLGTPRELGVASGTVDEARRGFEAFVAGMAEATYAELELIREGEEDAFTEVFGDADGSAVETWYLSSLDLCYDPE